MARAKRPREPLPPIWRLSDELWVIVRPINAELDPPHPPRHWVAERAHSQFACVLLWFRYLLSLAPWLRA